MMMGLLIQACVPAGQSGGSTGSQYAGEKRLRYDDFIYEPQIKSVFLFPDNGGANDPMTPPTVSLGAGRLLRLEFDELTNKYYNYYYRLIPCNWNWSPAILQDMEILEQYNEYTMDGYELSSGARVPYVHYYANVPKVKLSGNYLLVVYRNGNKDDVVLSRRFVVFESQMPIRAEVKFAAGVQERQTHQQIDFDINYSAYQVFNPAQTVKVVMRQNGRWDNAKLGIQPFFIREEDKMLDYHHVDLSIAFEGGNEWRSFDIRSIRFRGMNVANMTYDNTRADAWLGVDVTRRVRNYTYFVDANGRYVVARVETDGAATTADYVNTHFTLQPPGGGLPPGNVYVFGALTDWRIQPEYRLQPDSTGKYLTSSLLLKQGYYNFGYAFVPEGTDKYNLSELEGTYSLTENFYDIMVYYRPVGARYDQLAGYTRVTYNKPGR